jgi:uncharacterized protein YuzE
MDLVLKYDSKADILSVKLRPGEINDEKLLENDVLIGLDKEGELVALEIWDASKRGLYKTLIDLANEKRELVDTLLNRPVTNPA